MPSSIDHAVAYLEQRLPGLTNPYAVTITSYALANENKLNKEILYKFAARGFPHIVYLNTMRLHQSVLTHIFIKIHTLKLNEQQCSYF